MCFALCWILFVCFHVILMNVILRYKIYCIIFQAFFGVTLILLDFPICPIFPSLICKLDFNN